MMFSECSRWLSAITVATTVTLASAFPGTAAWGQPAPAELPKELQAGIIVPVQNNPATAKKKGTAKPQQTRANKSTPAKTQALGNKSAATRPAKPNEPIATRRPTTQNPDSQPEQKIAAPKRPAADTPTPAMPQASKPSDGSSVKRPDTESAPKNKSAVRVRIDSDPAPGLLTVIKPAPPTELTPTSPQAPAEQDPKRLPDNIHVARFQDLTPGQSHRQDVITKLGNPIKETKKKSLDVLTFKLKPFPKIEITLDKTTVTSIVVHDESATSRNVIVKQLDLSRFQPVDIRDNSGEPLGEIYPERGLTLIYQAGFNKAPERPVSHIVLEPITSDPFLLRAQRTADRYCTKALHDLKVVHILAPKEAPAYSLQSKLLARSGHLTAALEAAERANKLDPDQVSQQIAIAELQRQTRHFAEAQKTIQRVLARSDLDLLEQAAADLQSGKLLATMPPHDLKQAMNRTTAAVKKAAQMAREAQGDQQIHARRILVEAELWLARVISHGLWKQNNEVAPQWLASAEKTARQLITKDPNSQDVLLHVYCTSLECLDILNGQGTPDKMAEAAITLGRTLIAKTDDDIARAAIEWELGTGLWHAARVLYEQGKQDDAMRYANNANALLISAGRLHEDAASAPHTLAQVQFLIGSIYALHKRDHATALVWYQKALPTLKKTPPPSLQDQQGKIGDQLVSIGVSLWQTGNKQQGVEVTELGTERLQQAVKTGTLSNSALAVPWENLAAMHKSLGNQEKSRLLADKAAKITHGKKQLRR